MRFVKDEEHFSLILEGLVMKAAERVWIATANLKDLHLPQPGKRRKPLLRHFEKLQRSGVSFRILHGGVPSAPFIRTLNDSLELRTGAGFEMLHCPRNHSKLILVDGRGGYCGSANLTGAGMGARSPGKRNFETGFYTEDPSVIAEMEEYFDGIWMGNRCGDCRMRKVCPEPVSDR